jgi:hypothetical protein
MPSACWRRKRPRHTTRNSWRGARSTHRPSRAPFVPERSIGRHRVRGLRPNRTAAENNDRQPRREPDDGSAPPYGIYGGSASGRGHCPVARTRSRRAPRRRLVAQPTGVPASSPPRFAGQLSEQWLPWLRCSGHAAGADRMDRPAHTRKDNSSAADNSRDHTRSRTRRLDPGKH